MSGNSEVNPDALKNVLKKRNVTVRDPSQTIQQYGVHGEREPQSEQRPLPASSRRLTTISLSAIRPGRYQKRETRNEAQYLRLKSQIEELGFNFTAIVCHDPDDANYYNLMMGGHLRIQAAQELGITEVSAIIRDYDRTALAKGTYFENNGRQPLTLIEEGLIFRQCQEDEGWSQEEVARNLLVPGGRSHVALCLLATTAAPDIQEMLRQDPSRGQRCFYYLRQLDEIDKEKAVEWRAPIIHDFLAGVLTTDEVKIMVERIIAREQGQPEPGQEQEASSEQHLDLADVKRHQRITTTVKSFQRFAKTIGTQPPSPTERITLLSLKEEIEILLARGE